MSRLTLHTQETAPEGSRPFVDKAVANNGFLPNLIGVLANSPQALQTYMTVSGINAETSLTLPEREVVQITAARIHGCDFCIAGHTAIALKKAQLPVETVRRMKIAAQRLHGGETVERTAGHVGYNSYAAFSRAFHKVMGEHPGTFRRGRHVHVKTPMTGPIRTIEQKTRTGVSKRVFHSPLK